jgi:hypothetical protein
VGCFGDVAWRIFAFGLDKLTTELREVFGTMLKSYIDFGAEFFQYAHPQLFQSFC